MQNTTERQQIDRKGRKTMTDYLKGMVDMHIHLNPSVTNRYFDLIEMANVAKEAGYKAFLYKEHFLNTAPMCALIQKHLFPDRSPIIMGSSVLNNAQGGLNPEALKTAITFGAKIVWLPTSSAKQHWDFMDSDKAPGKGPGGPGGPGGKVPDSVKNGGAFGSRPAPDQLITLTDGRGELKKEVVEILKITRDTPDFLLSSGHASVPEIDALMDKACELGMQSKLFIDHPNQIIDASLADMKRWADRGAWIELVSSTAPKDAAEIIRYVGVDHCFYGSDLGMMGSGHCAKRYNEFLNELEACGITEAEIRQMTSTTVSGLLGLDKD